VSLDALAPDQRAVVQLVLQQERSYEELAELLGISTEAVRDRAHNGLDRLGPAESVAPDDRAAVADYLLGQQSVSEREATRSLLATSPGARDWALAVADGLRQVARGPLPEIPDAAAAALVPEADPTEDDEADGTDGADGGPADDRPAGDASPTVRARPRPRRQAERTRSEPAAAAGDSGAGAVDRPRSSLLGGALLIGGIAILLVILVVWLVTRDGGDDGGTSASSEVTPTATATATATPAFQQIGTIPLTGAGNAKGDMIIYASNSAALAFEIKATGMSAPAQGEAYAVWVTGGDKPHRLGFAPPPDDKGNFGTSGPRESDAANFPRWLSQAKRVVVSVERSQETTKPGRIVLSGTVPSGSGSGSGSG
jgi:hypothetical protein